MTQSCYFLPTFYICPCKSCLASSVESRNKTSVCPFVYFLVQFLNCMHIWPSKPILSRRRYCSSCPSLQFLAVPCSSLFAHHVCLSVPYHTIVRNWDIICPIPLVYCYRTDHIQSMIPYVVLGAHAVPGERAERAERKRECTDGVRFDGSNVACQPPPCSWPLRTS